MKFSSKTKELPEAEAALFIEQEIKKFVQTSLLNHMPSSEDQVIFDEPLVSFADGDDHLFTEYKTIIAPDHLTPREAMAKACGKNLEDMPARLSVISWVLPITEKTRLSNRNETQIPTRAWSHTRCHGEKFNDALREHVVKLLAEMGFLAVAPILQPFFEHIKRRSQGLYSNWPERHIAFAAGLGTFSLSDGFITERGIAHRCGSVVTDLVLPASPRTAESPYSNCLFYVDIKCRACILRCPAKAITEDGHDQIKCQKYIVDELAYLKKEYDVGVTGCGLCQVKVPCEFRNPTAKLRKKAG